MKAIYTHIPSAIERILVPVILATLMLAGVSRELRADDFFVRVAFGDSQKEAVALNVMVGQSRVILFDQPVGRFSVSNPEVAEAVLVAADQVVVNGKTPGNINFIAWDKEKERPLVFDVNVRVNLTLISALVHQLFPKDDIVLSQASGAVILSGNVSDVRKAAQAESAVQAAGFKTVNLLLSPVKDVGQVQLQVQVAEVNRTRARELGLAYSYQATPGAGGYLNTGAGPASVTSILNGTIAGTVASSLNVLFLGGNLTVFVKALQTSGALRTLAEPTLIAIDGQLASFLAGGEFPVPILQGSGAASSVTVQFKEFGVRLSFKPTIIDDEHIRLELEPEVSSIDFANGVTVSGFNIPSLKTRRAKTGIELQNGQGFVLAGLLDNSDTRTLSKIPLLGDIPVLGALFRSTAFQKNETELMFIVTVKLVKPVTPDSFPELKGLDKLKSDHSPLTRTPAGKSGAGGSGGDAGVPESKPSPETPSPKAPETQSPKAPETPSASNALPVACRPAWMQPTRICNPSDSSVIADKTAMIETTGQGPAGEHVSMKARFARAGGAIKKLAFEK